jgi:hypothetical protein
MTELNGVVAPEGKYTRLDGFEGSREQALGTDTLTYVLQVPTPDSKDPHAYTKTMLELTKAFVRLVTPHTKDEEGDLSNALDYFQDMVSRMDENGEMVPDNTAPDSSSEEEDEDE